MTWERNKRLAIWWMAQDFTHPKSQLYAVILSLKSWGWGFRGCSIALWEEWVALKKKKPILQKLWEIKPAFLQEKWFIIVRGVFQLLEAIVRKFSRVLTWGQSTEKGIQSVHYAPFTVKNKTFTNIGLTNWWKWYNFLLCQSARHTSL